MRSILSPADAHASISRPKKRRRQRRPPQDQKSTSRPRGRPGIDSTRCTHLPHGQMHRVHAKTAHSERSGSSDFDDSLHFCASLAAPGKIVTDLGRPRGTTTTSQAATRRSRRSPQTPPTQTQPPKPSSSPAAHRASPREQMSPSGHTHIHTLTTPRRTSV